MLAGTCTFAWAQLPEIRITTENNRDPTATTSMVSTCPNGQPPVGFSCPGGGFPTMSTVTNTDYVKIMTFQMTVPGNSQHNLNLTAPATGAADSIRVRGNSTATANKRPYRLKFDKRQPILGKVEARSWVLLAEFYDWTFALNPIAYTLGRRLGLEFTNSFQHVDVYINNSYKGIYLLTELMQVNPGRVNIDKDFGWLVEFDYHAPEPHHISFNTSGGNLSMQARVRDPEVNDNFNISNPTVSFVQREVNALFDAMAAQGFPDNGYRDLIDLESWAKYVLIQQLVDNFDFNSKVQAGGLPGSNYAYKDFGKRIHAGPLWDFDLSAGVVDPGMNMMNWPRHYVTHQEAIRPRHPFYQRLWDDPVFMAKFKKNWDKHQADFNAIPNLIDSIANSLAGRVQANFAAYSGGPSETAPRPTNEQTYRVHITNLKNWWTQRVQFFGQEINRLNIDTSKDIDQNANTTGTAWNNKLSGNIKVSAAKNSLDLKVKNNASVRVFRLDGREVRKINLNAGNHSVRINDLPKGMYMVRATVDGQKSAIRMPVR